MSDLMRTIVFNVLGILAILMLCGGLFWFVCVKLIPFIIGLFWHGGSPRL